MNFFYGKIKILHHLYISHEQNLIGASASAIPNFQFASCLYCISRHTMIWVPRHLSLISYMMIVNSKSDRAQFFEKNHFSQKCAKWASWIRITFPKFHYSLLGFLRSESSCHNLCDCASPISRKILVLELWTKIP